MSLSYFYMTVMNPLSDLFRSIDKEGKKKKMEQRNL